MVRALRNMCHYVSSREGDWIQLRSRQAALTVSLMPDTVDAVI